MKSVHGRAGLGFGEAVFQMHQHTATSHTGVEQEKTLTQHGGKNTEAKTGQNRPKPQRQVAQRDSKRRQTSACPGTLGRRRSALPWARDVHRA